LVRSAHIAEEVLGKLREVSAAHYRAGMARYGIEIKNALGVSMPNIRMVAKTIIRDHDPAEQL